MIGSSVAKTLFPHEDPVGGAVSINGLRYAVVGTLIERGNFFGQSRDDIVAIPVTLYLGHFNGSDEELFFSFLPTDGPSTTRAINEVVSALRRLRGVPYWRPNDFEVATQESLQKGFQSLTGGVFALMIAVAAISLLVGGIGIMNIMLVSVTERTREIGVRKALGATRQDILGQFLVEACVLSLTGGLIGIGLGGGTALMLRWLTTMPISVPPWVVLLSASVATIIGLIFGIYPANRAAKLDPIEALRYE